MLDIGTLVGDGLLALSTVGASYAARKTHKNSRKLESLAREDLNRRILEAVTEVLTEDERTAMRAYLHSLMRSSGVDTEWEEWRR